MVRQFLVYFVITNSHWIDRLIYKSSHTGLNLSKPWPEKTVDISWSYHLFLWEMTSKCREWHYPDRDTCSAFDWLKKISLVAQPIKSTTQFWVVTHYQHGISALIIQKSFCGQAIDGIAKCALFLYFCFSGWQSQWITLLVFFLNFAWATILGDKHH